jgi:hypothetical protein
LPLNVLVKTIMVFSSLLLFFLSFNTCYNFAPILFIYFHNFFPLHPRGFLNITHELHMNEFF